MLHCPELGILCAALYMNNSLSVQAVAQVPNLSRLPSLCLMFLLEAHLKKTQNNNKERKKQRTIQPTNYHHHQNTHKKTLLWIFIWYNEVVPGQVNVFPRVRIKLLCLASHNRMGRQKHCILHLMPRWSACGYSENQFVMFLCTWLNQSLKEDDFTWQWCWMNVIF